MPSFSSFSKKEISQFFASAQRVLKHIGLTILIAPKSISFGRMLVVAPRTIGNAPERNKVRRRIKSIFREEKLFESNFDYAFIVRKEAKSLSFLELKELILKAIKQ